MNLLSLLMFLMPGFPRILPTSRLQQFSNTDRERDDSVGKIAQSEIRFALELYQATAKVKMGFFAVSVADVFLILSQLHYGAQGLSQQQLSNVLHYSPDPNAEKGLKELVTRKANLSRNDVPTYDRIFYPYEWNLHNSFIEKTRSVFHTQPSKVSWNMLTSGNAIYEWAKKSGIIHPYKQTFEGEKSLVLAVGATFSANFVVKSSCTHEFSSAFYYNTNSFMEGCPYLRMNTQLNYGELKYRRDSNETQAKYIGIPWKIECAEKIKTFFILPNDRDGIAELEMNIDETMIHEILSNNNQDWVSTTLPKDIAIDSAYDLNEPLKNMNLTAMFDETTDFPQIGGNHSIKVGPVLQQVKIHHKWAWARKRDEESPGAPKAFNANHAFLILTVFMNENPFILYMGRHGWIPQVKDGETGVVL